MLIFLDIDGVMVPARGWKAPELLEDGFPAFSAQATAALRRLIAHDCMVLLTTSHKSNYSAARWKDLFRNRGLVISRLECLPQPAERLDRCSEILHWIEANQPDQPILILDDDASLHELPAHLKTFWIQPSPLIGLTAAHTDTAIALLPQA